MILVSDTSVLIDLERGRLIEPCFKLPFRLAVPDLLFNTELEEFNGPELVRHGLQVIDLTPAEVIIAQQTRTENRKLSLPDAFAYALASARNWRLLSGDGELRALAHANNVECGGVLWITDHLHEHQIGPAQTLVDGLRLIAEHPRCRLPREEIEIRIERYV